MIVICNSDGSAGAPGECPHDYAVTPGKRYLVLAITLVAGASEERRVLYQVLNDFDGVSHVPMNRFAVESGECSSHWIVRGEKDGSVLIWPEEFFVEYFHDDLGDGRRSAIDLFKQVVKKLKEEARFRP